MTWTVADLSKRVTLLAEQIAKLDPNDIAPRPLVEPLNAIERWADKHKNDPRNRSCIDRIEDQARSNEESFMAMVEHTGDYELDEDDDADEKTYEAFGDSPLSVTRKGSVIEVQESWGGPSDGYEVTMEGWSIESVRYYFRDWFDGAWLEIEKSDYPYTWQYLEYITQDVSEEVE
jgi:hypothetical protein